MDLSTVLSGIVSLYSQGGLALLLFAVLIILAGFFWKEYKAMILRHDGKMNSIQQEHKEQYTDIVKQMFEVLNKNTEAQTQLSSSIENLKDHIQYCKYKNMSN